MGKENYSFQLFNVRTDKERYEIVKNWWLDRKWDVPGIGALSTTGVMIYNNNQPVCAAWIYQTDSLVAMVGFIISDLKTNGRVKKNSLKLLLVKIEEITTNMGFKVIFLPVATDSIAKLGTKELSYVSTGKVNELSKIIN